MAAFSGRRILVVEDEALVAAMLADMIEESGAIVIGPTGSLSDAVHLAGAERFDAAVLDVNLHGSRIDPVVEVLDGRGIPFILTTGFDQAPEGRLKNVPTVRKPYDFREIVQGLEGILPSQALSG